MAERMNFRTQVDRYLRREDTVLARALRKACPLEGQEFRESDRKKYIEMLMFKIHFSNLFTMSLFAIGACAVSADNIIHQNATQRLRFTFSLHSF